MTCVKLRPRLGSLILEWLVILLVIFLFSRITLLDFNPRQLQQTGEHNESATLPILAEIGLRRYGEIPLWNPYMLTGFPHAGDLINHFWNPVATIPVLLWGGINGMKVSVFLSLLVAAYGQWFLAHTFGLRGIFRLWAGLLFALSGGLILLWRLGWYELLVGAAWFPWWFALLWRALHRRDRSSLIWAALAIAMPLPTMLARSPTICEKKITRNGMVMPRPVQRIRLPSAIDQTARGCSARTDRRRVITPGGLVVSCSFTVDSDTQIPSVPGESFDRDKISAASLLRRGSNGVLCNSLATWQYVRRGAAPSDAASRAGLVRRSGGA